MAATLLPDRTRQTASRTPAGHAQLRVRWDRVCLLALVAVLAIVVTDAVVDAVRGEPSTPGAQTVTIPTPDQPSALATQPASNPTSNRPVDAKSTCPKPATEVVRTAPAAHDDADPAARTVALTFDDGPGAATPQVLDVLQGPACVPRSSS